MPARQRREATQNAEVSQEAQNGNGQQRHAEATPKIIKGTLTGDPEARFTPTGKLIATLRIAESLPEGKTPTTWKVSL